MEIKNKKSILATLDEMIENLKYKKDGMSEERTREFCIKEGFRLVRDERIESGLAKKDNLRTFILMILTLKFFMLLVIGKGYHNYFTNCLQLRFVVW